MEKGAGIGTILPLTILNATSQSFFMGMFFFIGAYFTRRSFQKKGFVLFVRDRLIRLGIPLIITYFFLNVLADYIIWPAKHPDLPVSSFGELWLSGKHFSFGVMWFVLALSYFTILYIVSYYIIPALKKKEWKPLPQIKSIHILLFALFLGIVTYIVRIKFPLFSGSGSSWLPFDLGHFPQYIFLFILGIIAAGYNSYSFVSLKQIKMWLWFVLFLTGIVFPFMFFIGNVHVDGIMPYAGRGTLRSFAYAMWEQLTGISIMVILLGFMRIKWNTQNGFLRKLSDSSYAVYVLHPPVLVAISLLFKDWHVMLLIKFLALTPLALIGSFGIAMLIKNLPVFKRIF